MDRNRRALLGADVDGSPYWRRTCDEASRSDATKEGRRRG
jgi:hypothetical protein